MTSRTGRARVARFARGSGAAARMHRVAAITLASLISLGGCAAPEPPPDILLVTIDTLRPDALGWLGGSNDTPTLDRLAAEGLAFPHGVTSVPITLPAHAAMLSGCYPFRLGINDNGRTLDPSTPMLAGALAARGYRTAAFVSGFPLERMFGLDVGFDHYDDDMPAGREGYVERVARDTSMAALEWLRAQDSDTPVFAWVHFYDPHAPYTPPREFWRPGPRGSYDGEVAYTDHWLGALLEGWGQARTRERLTVVTSDHGEALGEHGEDTHGFFVYDSTVLAPIVWHWPGSIVARRDQAQVRHIDIAPTLAKIAGAGVPNPACEGIALDAVTSGAAAESRPAYVETFLPWNYFGWAPLMAVRESGWKYIDAPQPELYDIGSDPTERDNLVAHRPEARDRLVMRLDAVRQAPVLSDAGNASPDVLASLRGLGYIGMGPGAAQIPDDAIDPKLRVEMRRVLIGADQLLSQGRLEAGITALEQVLAEEPQNRFAALRAGTHLLQLGQPERALAYLERAVANDSERAEARYALGDALMRLQRHEPALQQWLELARLQPRRFEAWFNAATCHRQLGNTVAAEEALRRAREIDPDHPALETRPAADANGAGS